MVLATAIMQAQTIFVSTTGDNTDGSTWAKAYTSIQAALTAATSGNEIWVKQGTYTIATETEQLNFVEGVNVYGGFVGNESTLAQRSSDAALTIISHDAAGTGGFRLLKSTNLNTPAMWDGFTFNGSNVGMGILLAGNCTITNSIVKNCTITNGSGAGVYMTSTSNLAPSVLTNTQVTNNILNVETSESGYLIGGAGVRINTNVKDGVVVDNCTISNNAINANIGGNDYRAYGAGIMIHSGTVKNTIIDGNKVQGTSPGNVRTGAGVAIIPESSIVHEVLIESCTIQNSDSGSARGSGVLIDPSYGGQYDGNYTISKTIIRNNVTTSVGGGILCTAATAQSGGGWTLNIENSIIANNTAATGSGIFMNIGATLNITYSNIVNNKSTAQYGGGIHFQGVANHTIAATLVNSIIWGNVYNGTAPERTQFRNNGQSTTMTNCAMQDLTAITTHAEWSNTTLADNQNLNSNNTDAAGPNFFVVSSGPGQGVADALTARWEITENSTVLIDSGIYAFDANSNEILMDYAGAPRPADGSFEFTDIGAFEFDSENPPSLSIKNPIVTVNPNLILYPTAATTMLNIEASLPVKHIEVYSINGSSVLTTKATTSINVSTLSSGLYLLRATFNNDKVVIKRFVKH